MKRAFTAIILSALVLSVTGCGGQDDNNASATEQPTQAVTEAATQPTDYFEVTQPADETDPPVESSQTNSSTTEFTGEQINNVSSAGQSGSNGSKNDITQPDYFAGSWSPAKAESRASGEEISFDRAFGSSYAQYGGAFTVYEDGYFEIGMGAYGEEGKHKGVFKLNGTSLNVTYDDNSEDSFEYIDDYNGKEAVKAVIGDYFVYFTR